MATDLLTLAGQTFHLLPTRCLYWQEAQALVLADLHLGKAAHLRHHGLPVPEGHTADDLARLTASIHQTQPREIIIAGDLFHAPSAQSPTILRLVEAWRHQHPNLTVSLIIGNHDLGRALPPPSCGITPVGPLLHRPPFHIIHDPAHATHGQPTLCGHLHPVLSLPGPRPLKAPCFWWQAACQTLVLPAFGTFIAGVPIQPAPGDSLHAIYQDTILPIPPALHPRPKLQRSKHITER